MVVFSAIVPHPPLSIPGIGNGEQLSKLQRTIQSLDGLRVALEHARPETVVVITPHGHMEEYSFVLNRNHDLSGDLDKFGLSAEYSYENDLTIVDRINYVCEMNEVPVEIHHDPLDHGTVIPLHHLLKNISPKLVHISFSLLDFVRHFEFGKLIGQIFDSSSKRIAVIASADLSHRITSDSPAGYSPSAKYFDLKVIEILKQRDTDRLMKLEQHVIDEAAECGLRSIIVLLGIMNGRQYDLRILSYEHPFGVGHLVARLV
jgi:aromatic ring-opening dioxygenase LigB subunit